MTMPMEKIFLTPKMSANLPKGIRNMDAARKKTVASQLIATASMENSMPMVGMATIRADTMKGARKEPPAEIIRIFLLAGDDAMLTIEYYID